MEVHAMAGNSLFTKTSFVLSALFALAAAPFASALEGAEGKEFDVFDTGRGELKITFLGHASLVFEFGGARVYVDPVSQYGDFSKYPKADLILVTHEHGDHLDAAAIGALRKPSTKIILPEASRKKLGAGEALEFGRVVDISGLGISGAPISGAAVPGVSVPDATVEAVPAYNVTAGHANYHPRERRDTGYILTFGNIRVYVAGDTEPIPEMAAFGRIGIAFLPMNQPYTMTPEQVAVAVRTIRPKILYPYHFGSTEIGLLSALLAGEPGTEIRARKLQ
jgi:L-ascorbate metabolism protein UlaG (beta-lactamase superfamily)